MRRGSFTRSNPPVTGKSPIPYDGIRTTRITLRQKEKAVKQRVT